MRRSGNDRLFFESFLKAYPTKVTAWLLVGSLAFVSCAKEGALSRSLDRLDYDTLPAKAPRPKTPGEKLHAAAADLQDLLAVQARRDLSGDQADKARAARDALTTELGALHRQFAADRDKLEKLGAKGALARLGKIDKKSAGLESSLRAALAQVPADGKRAASATGAADALADLSPEKRDQPLSSDLGFGMNNARPRPASLSTGVTPAYNAPAPNETASDLPRSAEQEDLAETPETTVTPAIHELGQQLGGDPVKIYEFVRNNVRYEPYYGIRKGADQTLAELSGSDADQAALTIALLRDSGIHARFVQGTAQLPAAKAANWLGVDTQAGERLEAAPDILASGGIPATQIRANGQLAKVRFGHIWAEAYVPDEAYRGVDEQLGGKAWLPLDPSIKETVIHQPDDELKSLLRPISEQYARNFVEDAAPSGDSVLELPNADEFGANAAATTDRVKGLMSDQGIDDESDVTDLVGATEIRRLTAPYLPSTLQAQTLSVAGELRGIPSSLQSRITFAVSGSDPFSLPNDPEDANGGGFTFTAPTADLANKRVTLAYVPATEEDAEIIDAYHGLLNAPSYAASLIPVLRVDGRVVARGHTAVSTGYTQTFEITYRSPGYAADTVTNPVYVGSLSAVGLDLGTIARPQLKARAHALGELAESTTPQNVVTDARGGEMLSQLASLYFLRGDAFNSVLGRAAGVHQSRDLSGAITATSLTPTYIASFPVGVRFDGLTIDVDQDSQVVVGKSASDSSIDNYMRLSGAYASASEAAIFEYALGWGAVSTSTVMSAAAEQGVPVHRVTSENVDAELGRLQLSAQAEREIAKAVTVPGVEVVTPERTMSVGGWTGVGYVITAEHSTDYRISGGISGGAAGSPPSSGGSTGAMDEGVDTASDRTEKAADCDWAMIVALSLFAILFVLAAFAFGALALSIWGAFTIAWGAAGAITLSLVELGFTALHVALVSGFHLLVAGMLGVPVIEELEENC